jgi:hypothetical protein
LSAFLRGAVQKQNGLSDENDGQSDDIRVGDYLLDAGRVPCLTDSHKLVSLWDMIRFYCWELCDHLEQLRCVVEVHLLNEMKAGRRAANLTGGHSDCVIKLLKELQHDCTKLQLDGANNQINRLRQCVLGFNPPCNYEVVSRDLRMISDEIISALKKRKFSYIPFERDKYFEAPALFGRAVLKNFRSLRSEIKDAGNCFAAGLDTAAMFHLMRIAEKGLRTLAVHLGVRKTRDKTPIDLATQGKIIGALNDKLKLLGQPVSGRQVKQREFYADLLSSLTGFKDLWRNEVSHSDKRYDEHDSAKAMRYVGDFMTRLATKVSERN